MGVHILLFAKGKDIGSDLWERVYTESLVLLRNFPAPLTRVAVENVGEEERYSFTSEIVRDRGTREERWVVAGDMKSRTPAAPFELYRYHDHQFPTNSFFAVTGPNTRDVLWAKPTGEPHDIHGNGYTVWNSKTQGRPYHYAVLAVGMLVESRCPGCAYVTGDIDLSQAEEVRQWANPLLEEPLAPPICVDPDRLFARLSEIYEHESDVVSRATSLFLGTDTELHRAVMRHGGSATADAWFKRRLEDFDSLSHPGASELVVTFLENTEDVPRLMGIVQDIASAREQETAKRDGFSLDCLLEELCRRFITIPPDERRMSETDWAAAAASALTTSDEALYESLLKITATPSPLPVFIAANELLELFSQPDPEQHDQFAETIHTGERDCREILARLDDARGEMRGLSKARETFRTPTNGTSGGPEAIRAEIAYQTVRYDGEEDLARETGELIRGKLISAPVVASPRTSSELLSELYRATRTNRIALTESAWSKIDALQDETVLRHLLALAAIKNDEMHFCDMRLYILENPRLWPVLAGG